MATPLLGFITKAERTQAQADAHEAAFKSFHPRLNLVGVQDPTPPQKVVLTQAFKHPKVLADIGFEFNGFRQLTGSCVGVSEGDCIATIAAVQRLVAANPTKAFVPWWAFAYGRTRYNEGDRGQGEGAVDSVMAATLIKEGTLPYPQDGLPQFDKSDGLSLPSSVEMAYSDGASSLNTKWLTEAAKYPVGSAAVLNSSQDIRAAILNGYPVLDGCDNYIGNGSLQGSGSDAVCIGAYDGRGGHSTCYVGYWDHPTLGPLYLYWNQWSGSTYPEDGSGKVRCSVWVKEKIVDKLFQTGGGGGETVALSHLTYFPAQPDVPTVLDWVA